MCNDSRQEINEGNLAPKVMRKKRKKKGMKDEWMDGREGGRRNQ